MVCGLISSKVSADRDVLYIDVADREVLYIDVAHVRLTYAKTASQHEYTTRNEPPRKLHEKYYFTSHTKDVIIFICACSENRNRWPSLLLCKILFFPESL